MSKRSSAVLVYEDKEGKVHCRMCCGVVEDVPTEAAICTRQEVYSDYRCHCSGGRAERFDSGFMFDNTKHKILLSPNINKITDTDISSIANRAVAYISTLDNIQ